MRRELCDSDTQLAGSSDIEESTQRWQRQGKKLLVASALLSSSLGLLATNSASAAECTDTDGDGYGWDGNNTCDPNATTTPESVEADARHMGSVDIDTDDVNTDDVNTEDDASSDNAASNRANNETQDYVSNTESTYETPLAVEAEAAIGTETASAEKTFEGTEVVIEAPKILSSPARAECTDTDGDGYGWDGIDTCTPNVSAETSVDNTLAGVNISFAVNQISTAAEAKPDPIEIPSADPVADTLATETGDETGDDFIEVLRATASNQPAECIDTDGDGYGWNGDQTCNPSPVAAGGSDDIILFELSEERSESEVSLGLNVDQLVETNELGEVLVIGNFLEVDELGELVEIPANWDSDAQGVPTGEAESSDGDTLAPEGEADSETPAVTYEQAARNEFKSTGGVPAASYLDPPGQKTYTENGGYIIAIENDSGLITGTYEVVVSDEGQTRILSGDDGSREHADTRHNDGSVSIEYYENGALSILTNKVTTETETVDTLTYPRSGIEKVETYDNLTNELTTATTYSDRVETTITGAGFTTKKLDYLNGEYSITTRRQDGSVDIDGFADGVRLTLMKPNEGPGSITYNGTEFRGQDLKLDPNTDVPRWEILGSRESIQNGSANESETQLINDIVDGLVGPIEPFDEWTRAVHAMHADKATAEQMALILQSLTPTPDQAILRETKPTTAEQAAQTYTGATTTNGEYDGTPTRETAQQAAATYANGNIVDGEFAGVTTPTPAPAPTPTARPIEHKSSLDERQEASQSTRNTADDAAETYSGGDNRGEFF